jgi:hypothetical protein
MWGGREWDWKAKGREIGKELDTRFKRMLENEVGEGESETWKDEDGRNKKGVMLEWNGAVERLRGERDALYILYTVHVWGGCCSSEFSEVWSANKKKSANTRGGGGGVVIS